MDSNDGRDTASGVSHSVALLRWSLKPLRVRPVAESESLQSRPSPSPSRPSVSRRRAAQTGLDGAGSGRRPVLCVLVTMLPRGGPPGSRRSTAVSSCGIPGPSARMSCESRTFKLRIVRRALGAGR